MIVYLYFSHCAPEQLPSRMTHVSDGNPISYARWRTGKKKCVYRSGRRNGKEKWINLLRIKFSDVRDSELYRSYQRGCKGKDKNRRLEDFDKMVPPGHVLAVLAYSCEWDDISAAFYREDALDREEMATSSAIGFLFGSHDGEHYREIGSVPAGFEGELELELFSISKTHKSTEPVLLAFAEDCGLSPETALLLSSPFGGGMGRLREVCGAHFGGPYVGKRSR